MLMEDTVKQRLSSYIRYKGMSNSQFCKAIGVSSAYISSMRQSISNDKTQSIALNFPDLNITWLLTGEGEMLKKNYENQKDRAMLLSEPSVEYGHRHRTARPYYAVDFFGGFDLTYNEQKTIPDGVVDIPAYSNADFWVNVTGKSMEPLISSGDLIALKRIDDWRNGIFFGEVYAIVTTDDQRTIKRIRKSEDRNAIRLVPENKDYDAQDMPLSHIRFVFKVVGAVKSID